MSDPSAIRVVTVVNTQGLHARPADLFARQANRFQSRIEIIKENECVDGKSVLGILTLGAQRGVQLTLQAYGEDAEEAVEALARLIEHELLENERRTNEET